MLVYVARFRHTKGRYVIVEGDPTDAHLGAHLGAQKLHPTKRQLNEMYRSFSRSELEDVKIRDIDLVGPLGDPLTHHSVVSPHAS